MRKQAFLLTLPFILLTPGQAISGQLDGANNSSGMGPVESSKHAYGEQSGDLPNFHEVHPFLYRGGQPSSAGLKKLKDMGIATIIDLRGNPEKVLSEVREAQALGIKTINLPMSDQAPTAKQVSTFVKTVESAASSKSNGPVFVHCAHGSDRTGCLVGIWRVTHDGWTYDQAYQEMRKYYFGPKFTQLSGSVKEYALTKQAQTASP